VGLVTLGNFYYEEGNSIRPSCEFMHQFPSENEVKSEFQDASFDAFLARYSEKFRAERF